MGMIRRITVGFAIFCVCLILFACENADVSLFEITMSEVQAHSGVAYYLSDQGQLYCPGVDRDSASFTVYIDQPKGLVAENVKSFGECTGGGYYIDFNNNLYMWNENAIPLLGYYKSAEHIKILENVKFATASNNCIIYIDMNSSLYLIGTFEKEKYSIENPKFLGKDVVCAAVKNGTVLWAKSDGSLEIFGNTDSTIAENLNAQFANESITSIYLEKDFAVVLSNHRLWYYGDYNKLITGKESQMINLTMLAEDVTKVSCSAKTIMALDTNGKALLWGRCISNDARNTVSPLFDYYERYCLTQTAKYIFVSDSCVCYIDENSMSNIYYASGWPIFYGNSTKDACVGIMREPSKWIE